ncbi:MAG: adenylosuccinate synthase [Planctomycetota bacterium]|nr:adenylosuccinate synthase [Planctomycetota bacterium]
MNFNALGNTSVVGLQWGDEGKGKIVDLLTEHFDVVVRYAGGANAGHTVIVGDQRFALHLVPSGILRPDVLSLIGPGVALDLETIMTEIAGLRERGIKVDRNLLISNRAHLVMPYHKKQDLLSEARLDPDRKIGTTARGIGPCYADKMLRSTAFRLADLYKPDAFRSRLRDVVADRNKVFNALYGETEPFDADAIADQFLEFGERIRMHVVDTTQVLHEALARCERLLFEGAQGSLLDIDHGTFPYVTSSTCTAGGVAAGAGVPPACIHDYVGVIKAYTTRVGSGPFPTELTNATGDAIRVRGHEYGTTTGRPRRCGWFDAFATKYSMDLARITQLCVMHLDTLGGFPEVRVCTGYRYRGERLKIFPPDIDVLNEVEPIYETMPGWDAEINADDSYEQLPLPARRYVERLEDLLAAPITLVSVGADRLATLHRQTAPPAMVPAR